jgi:hypothetical protein
MFDGIGKDTVEAARQGLLGCIDRLKEVAVEFLDESEIHMDPLRVWFKRRDKQPVKENDDVKPT